MKRITITLLVICMALLCLCSCAVLESRITKEQNTDSATQPQSEPVDDYTKTIVKGSLIDGYCLEMALDYASTVFVGVCTGKPIHNKNGTVDAEFTVEKVIRGNIKAGDTLMVRQYDESLFVYGNRSIVLSEEYSSVYEGIKSVYAAGEIINQQASKYNGDMPDVKGMKYDDILKKIEQYAEKNTYKGENTAYGVYSESDKLEDIADFANCIVKVKTAKITNNTVSDRTSYECKVIESLKGETASIIPVIAFKDSMQVGKEYVLLLTKVGEVDTFYIMAAKQSVFSADSEQARSIKEYVQKNK